MKKPFNVVMSRYLTYHAVLEVKVLAESEEEALQIAEKHSFQGHYDADWDYAEHMADCDEVETTALFAEEEAEQDPEYDYDE